MKTDPAQSRPAVLLVEDNPHVSRIQIRLLEQAGFQVALAETGTDGLRLIRESLPAAVILDGELPGMDGFEVCRQMRADERTRNIPVLFCSARLDAHERALAAGGDDFLAKPEDMAQLAERLVRLLQK